MRTLTHIAVLGVSTGLLNLPAEGRSGDPWPLWGRTNERLSNTQSIGPKTPTLDWSIRFSDDTGGNVHPGSCVMDAQGRIFVPTKVGVTVIDSSSRSILWETTDGSWVPRAPTVFDGKVYWGEHTTRSTFFCFDIERAQELWRLEAPESAFGMSPVIADIGIVYFQDLSRNVYARRADNGADIWTQPLPDGPSASPSLASGVILVTGNESELVRLDPKTGTILWRFPTGGILSGTSPITDDRVYVSSWGRTLFALDNRTGQEIWRRAIGGFGGADALGHDGTIYSGSGSGTRGLMATSPSGTELWRFIPNGFISHPAVIDGDEMIYACAWRSSPSRGWVHAVRPNGAEFWTHELEFQCSASPMLAPDGTLYVVSWDRYLYAFRDPHVRATITNLQTTTGEILDGGIEELGEVDDSYLRTRSGFGDRVTDLHKMELVISARVSDSQPEIMRIQIKSKIDEPNGTARISLRNWQTGDLEIIREYAIGLDDPFEWIQIPEGGNAPYVDPQRYIRPNGAIEMQLKHTVFVPFLAFTFDSFIDQIKIEVN